MVALTVLAVLNTVLLLGVIRRVNQLARATPSPAPPGEPSVTDFAAVTTGGETVSPAQLSGRTLAGFFAVGCPPCEEFLPEFTAYAGAFPGGRDQVLAVVTAKRGDPAELVRRLERVARVVVEPARGPVATAFGMDAFPAVCLLENSTLIAVDFELSALNSVANSTILPGN